VVRIDWNLLGQPDRLCEVLPGAVFVVFDLIYLKFHDRIALVGPPDTALGLVVDAPPLDVSAVFASEFDVPVLVIVLGTVLLGMSNGNWRVIG